MSRPTSNAERPDAPSLAVAIENLTDYISIAARTDSSATREIVRQASAALRHIIDATPGVSRRHAATTGVVSPPSASRRSRRPPRTRTRRPARADPTLPHLARDNPILPRAPIPAPFTGLSQAEYPMHRNTRGVRASAHRAASLGIPLVPGERILPWRNALEVGTLLGDALGGGTAASLSFPWPSTRHNPAVYDISRGAFSRWVRRAWEPRIGHCESALSLAETITGAFSPLPNGVSPRAVIQVLTFQVTLMQCDYRRQDYPDRAILRVGFKEATLFPTPVDTITEIGRNVISAAVETRLNNARAVGWVAILAKHCFCWVELPQRGGPLVRHIGTDYFWAQPAAPAPPAPGLSYSTDTSHDEEAEEDLVGGGELFGSHTF